MNHVPKTTVKVPDKLHVRLKVLAAQSKKTLEEIVAEALMQYLAAKGER